MRLENKKYKKVKANMRRMQDGNLLEVCIIFIKIFKYKLLIL